MKSLFYLFLLFPSVVIAQISPRNVNKKIGANPVFIIDSTKVSYEEFSQTNPRTIATLTILTDSDAIKAYGDTAKDGVIICETHSYAKTKYIKFFRQVSHSYDSLYTITNSDNMFQYIINDKIKTPDDDGDLASINGDLFISLEILTADDLKNRYGITGKSYGILIKSRKPANLYHKNKKF